MSNEEQIDLLAKPVLTGLLSDADYIKELEGLVCFLAGCYGKAKETYFDKHMNTCSVENPNRRDLADAEKSELLRFPLIQGIALQHTISDIAKSNKPTPSDIQGLLRRIEALENSTNTLDIYKQGIIDSMCFNTGKTTEQAILALVEFGMVSMIAAISPPEQNKIMNVEFDAVFKDDKLRKTAEAYSGCWSFDEHSSMDCSHPNKYFVGGVFGGYWCPKCNRNVDADCE